jgi:single-stranded-DNA-specific exonuclease
LPLLLDCDLQRSSSQWLAEAEEGVRVIALQSEDEVIEQARNMDPGGKRCSLVLHSPEWHKGIIGIVASRIVETFYRPVVMLSGKSEILTGSARSIPGFDLYAALEKCKRHFTAFGGHKAAAGMSLPAANLEAFRKDFEEAVRASVTEEMLTPVIEYDLELPAEEINQSFYKLLYRMGPYGQENMLPVIVSRNVTFAAPPRIVGDKHLKLTLSQNGNKKLSAIGFNLGHYINRLPDKQPFDICYSIEKQWYMGKARYEMHLKDLNVQ